MTPEPLIYHDGDLACHGELTRPATPNGRAALVAHEADGIGGNVRRRCATLAELGYMTLAADLHGEGRVLEGEAMHEALDAFRADPDRLRHRIRAALDALLAQDGVDPARTVALGYCFGGYAVLELARSGAALAGVVSFHGLLTTRAPAQPGAIRTRVAAFTGARDPIVPPADIAAFQHEMMHADADWQCTVYGQAWHSFTNIGVQGSSDERMRYDPAADRQSWAAALAVVDEAVGR